MAPSHWLNPLPLELRLTSESTSFLAMHPGTTGLPIAPHPGAYGVQRRNHVHEGVDLYAAEGTPVLAVERGIVVAVLPFTGPSAGLPWWLETEVVMVEGASGVVAYGEVRASVLAGATIEAGTHVGDVLRVLRADKGRPTSMLHLELHTPGARACPEWRERRAKPATLLDPTPKLWHLAS